MTAAISTPMFRDPREPAFRLSVEQYEQMIRVGVIDENDPVELIDGRLVFKMSVNEPHETSVGMFQDLIPALLPIGWVVRLQATLKLSESMPEPDVAIVRGKRTDYGTRRPTPVDASLVVEISDSTLYYDRTTKLAMYARDRVAEYWIVNLIDRQIEVYTQPDAAGPEPRYLSRVDRKPGEPIALPATLGGATIDVAALLPPA